MNAELFGVPVGAPADPAAAPAAVPIVRNLRRSNQGFSM